MEISTKEYLRSTSNLAQKIAQDLDGVRDAYQDLWSTLNEKEKNQVLDEAIIDPAAVLKYSHVGKNEPIAYFETGKGCQFSWFTKSQLNLFTDVSLKTQNSPLKKAGSVAIPADNVPQDTTIIDNKTKENNLLNKIKNKVTNLKIPTNAEEKQNLVESKPHVAVVLKSSLSKPKTPPPPPPTKQVLSEKKALLSVDNESDTDDIPKTGFDFLDNW